MKKVIKSVIKTSGEVVVGSLALFGEFTFLGALGTGYLTYTKGVPAKHSTKTIGEKGAEKIFTVFVVYGPKAFYYSGIITALTGLFGTAAYIAYKWAHKDGEYMWVHKDHVDQVNKVVEALGATKGDPE